MQAAIAEGSVVGQVGGDAHPVDEAVRFKGNYNLAFAAESYSQVKPKLSDPSAASDIKIKAEQQAREIPSTYTVIVNFIGLAGAAGILPQHYTRLIMERLKQRDRAMADFIDIFHHRLVSLFYRGWQKYRFTNQYEAYALQGKRDPFSYVLQCLSGAGSSVVDEIKTYYSGYFSKKVRTISGLKSLLEDFLQCEITIHSFKGQWLHLASSDRFILSATNPKYVLGQGVLLGRRCWDVQSKISVELGPLTHEQYHHLGPGSEAYSQTQRLVDAYLPTHLSVDFEYKVESVISKGKALGKGVQLQRNGWLGSKEGVPLRAKVSVNRNGL